MTTVLKTTKTSKTVARAPCPRRRVPLCPSPPPRADAAGGRTAQGQDTTLPLESIVSLTSFGLAVYKAAKTCRKQAGGAPIATGLAAKMATAISSLSVGEIFPPEPVYAALALLALQEMAEAGGCLRIPAGWNSALARIVARSGESGAREALSILYYMDVRYPGALVWETP